MCTGVDIADGGLLVQPVEDELVLVRRRVRQCLGLLGVLLKLLLQKKESQRRLTNQAVYFISMGMDGFASSVGTMVACIIWLVERN